MHPEQWVTLKWVQVVVEIDVVLVGELPGALSPRGIHLVDCFPLQLHRHCHEIAVGVDQGADPSWFDVLQLLLHQVENHIGAWLITLSGTEAEVGGSITAPAHRVAVRPRRSRHQFHLLRHHETGVEAQAEMADDRVSLLFVLLQKILGTGEGNLVDVALHLIGGHADAVVSNGELFSISVNGDADNPVFAFAAVARHGRHTPLADGVDTVADQLAEKHLMAGVHGLLDDREDVLGVDLNLTLFVHHRHWTAGKI